jgi:hypothetical protein
VSIDVSCTLLIVVITSPFRVSRKILQIVILVCLVALALAYPLIESLDHWDAAGPASDSELEGIVVLTLAGVIWLFTQLQVFLAVAASPQPLPALCFRALLKWNALPFSSDLTASPPIALRI